MSSPRPAGFTRLSSSKLNAEVMSSFDRTEAFSNILLLRFPRAILVLPTTLTRKAQPNKYAISSRLSLKRSYSFAAAFARTSTRKPCSHTPISLPLFEKSACSLLRLARKDWIPFRPIYRFRTARDNWNQPRERCCILQRFLVTDEVTASPEETTERQTPRTDHAAFSQRTIISVSLWHID